jgi:hypothetical protein
VNGGNNSFYLNLFISLYIILSKLKIFDADQTLKSLYLWTETVGVPGENERNSSEITLGSANLFLRYSPSVFTPMETHKISPHVQGSSFGDLQS